MLTSTTSTTTRSSKLPRSSAAATMPISERQQAIARNFQQGEAPTVSWRVANLCQAILYNGKDFVDATDLQGLVDQDWPLFCNFLSSHGRLRIQSIVLLLDRIRHNSTAKQDLFAFLRDNTCLTHVTLTSRQVESSAWVHEIVKAVAQGPCLETLEILRLALQAPADKDTFAPLQEATALRNISTINLDDDTQTVLTHAVAQYFCPQQGVQEWTCQGGPACRIVPQNIVEATTVQSLALEGHQWNAEAFRSVTELTTTTNASLQRLDIQGCTSLSTGEGLSEPLLSHFVKTLALPTCRLQHLGLSRLDLSLVPPDDLATLVHAPNMTSLALQDVSNDQAQALVAALTTTSRATAMTSLTLQTNEVVSIETLDAAATCIANNSNLTRLALKGTGIPTLTFARPRPGGRISCRAEISFCPVRWNDLVEWILQQCSLNVEWTWTVRSFSMQDDIAGICRLLEHTRHNMTHLYLFWSSRGSNNCGDSLIAAMKKNHSLMHVDIDNGCSSHASTQNLLQDKCQSIVSRNRIDSLLRVTSLPAAVWACVLGNGDHGTRFWALRNNALGILSS